LGIAEKKLGPEASLVPRRSAAEGSPDWIMAAWGSCLAHARCSLQHKILPALPSRNRRQTRFGARKFALVVRMLVRQESVKGSRVDGAGAGV
jgi:hypothetical protein